jgi:hypothetical protein
MRRRISAEAGEQHAILGFLQAESILAFRMNTGVHVAEYNGRKRIIRFGVPGMGDIISFPWFKGRTHPDTLWIEVKSETGRQRLEQKSFQQQVEACGLHYVLARSIDDVKAKLERMAKA